MLFGFPIDPRVKDWPMMSSPFPTLALCIFYAYFSKVLAPKLMANRKAFDLRNLLVAYNLFQTVFSAWIFYEVSIIWMLNRCVLSVCVLFVCCLLFFTLYVVRLSCVSVCIWLASYATTNVTIHFSFVRFFFVSSISTNTVIVGDLTLFSVYWAIFSSIFFLFILFNFFYFAVSSQWMGGSLQFQMPARWLFKR